MTSRGWRIADGVMLAVFLLSAAVQVNDPDPLPWIVAYGAAAAICAAALGGRAGRAAPLAVLAIALAAAAPFAPRVVGRAGIADVFGSMKATDPLVEETREMLGLVIIAAWMASVAWRAPGAPAAPREKGESP